MHGTRLRLIPLALSAGLAHAQAELPGEPAAALLSSTAADDAAATVQGVPVRIPVLANDMCAGGCQSATLRVDPRPAHGSVAPNSDGELIYLPYPDFSGTDGFGYVLLDPDTGKPASNPAGVTVSVGAAPPAELEPEGPGTHAPPLPVTDRVILKRAAVAEHRLFTEGRVTRLNGERAARVEIYSGAAAGQDCLGSLLGSAAVNEEGHWEFSAWVSSTTLHICVQSRNGGVADSPL